MQSAEESGEFTYVPPSSDDADKTAVVLDRSMSGGGGEVEGLPSSSAALEVDHVSQRMV